MQKRVEISAVLIAALFAGSNQSIAQSQRTLARTAERTENIRMDPIRPPDPVFTGQAALSVELNRSSDPILWSVGREGAPEEIRFSIPGADYITVSGIAGTENGTIAVHGAAYSSEHTGGSFLGIIPPDRSKKIIVRLVPYYPDVVTVASDGTIWTIGYDDDNKQQNILRRFDQTGKLLSTAKIKVHGKVNGGAAPGSTLRASRDRVGWMTNLYEYIEFSLNGAEIFRVSGPPWHPITEVFTTFAISASDQVVAAVRQPTQSEPTMWSLDRTNHGWIPVDAKGAGIGETADLLGFDGEDLFVRVWSGDRSSVLSRFGMPSSK
jgi:hypothetical protein